VSFVVPPAFHRDLARRGGASAAVGGDGEAGERDDAEQDDDHDQ
jgi:hypothetical protein